MGKVDDVPGVRVVQVSQVQVVEESVEFPQLLLVEKFVVCSEVLTFLFTQTFECLGTARGVQFLDKVVDVPVVVMTGAWCCQCRKLWSSCSALTS